MQIKLEYEAFKVVDVILKPVGPVLWCLTLSKTHMIYSDDTEMFGPDRDLLSEEIAPGRLTVKQQQSIWTRTYVDIMHSETRGIIISGGKRPSVVERFVGGDGTCTYHSNKNTYHPATSFSLIILVGVTSTNNDPSTALRFP